MTVSITPEQRDVLYEQALVRLSGIGDELAAAIRGDVETATRLGREYSDELRLILDDLGWGEGSGGAVELSTPPPVLRRVLGRMRDVALVSIEQARSEQAEARDHELQSEFLRETCDALLARLDGREMLPCDAGRVEP
jgi:hypothetical protein